MSVRRRLQRLAESARLTPRALSPEAALHGCETCRDVTERQAYTRDLIESGRASEMLQLQEGRTDGRVPHQRLQCDACGAYWLICFFPDEKGELCVRFAPVAPPTEVN